MRRQRSTILTVGPLVGLLVVLVALTIPKSSIAKSKARPAVEFDLEVLQGEGSGKLDASRGKVVILEFWATYCGWCKATHPKLAAFASEHSEAVIVLGISAQKKSRLQRYLRRHQTGLTVLHDPRAKISRAYQANQTPTLVVIDPEGTMRAWAQGGNELKAILRVAKSLAD